MYKNTTISHSLKRMKTLECKSNIYLITKKRKKEKEITKYLGPCYLDSHSLLLFIYLDLAGKSKNKIVMSRRKIRIETHRKAYCELLEINHIFF